MKLKFCIEYQTIFGQDLVLNIVEGQKQGVPHVSEYRMQTTDGLHWEYILNSLPKSKKSIDYYYSVERGNQQERREWGVVAHKLEVNSKSAGYIQVFDRWIDVPEDSYLYTSAITDCVVGKKLEKVKEQSFARTVRLKVRAPQLRRNRHLRVAGTGDVLGDWDVQKGLDLTEHNINEWIVDLDVTKLTSGIHQSPVTLEFKFISYGDKD